MREKPQKSKSATAAENDEDYTYDELQLDGKEGNQTACGQPDRQNYTEGEHQDGACGMHEQPLYDLPPIDDEYSTPVPQKNMTFKKDSSQIICIYMT